MSDSPIWWGQLVRSTAINQADLMREVMQEWLDTVAIENMRFIWAVSSTTPTALSMQTSVVPLSLDGLLEKIQPLLGDTEFMIFAEMVDGDVFNRGYVNYHLVSRYCIGHYSGDEIAKRAERTVLHLHEDLQKELDAGGGSA